MESSAKPSHHLHAGRHQQGLHYTSPWADQGIFCFQVSPGCSQVYFNCSTSVGRHSGIAVAQNPPVHVPPTNSDLRWETADNRPLPSPSAPEGSPVCEELHSYSVLLVPKLKVEQESSCRHMGQEAPTAAVNKSKQVQPSNSNC